MDIIKPEEIGLIAQEISFAFEDSYPDIKKRKLFKVLFDRYLLPLDPDGVLEPYEIIIKLGRKNPSEFKHMVKEMQDKKLIELSTR